MTKPKKDSFKNLSNFCDEDFEDPWENTESADSLATATERYTHKELLATGGMKEIYKVYDTKMKRFIAMARLIPDSDEELAEVFLKEAALTASLEHPNIISVYDFGINENLDPFFTMELKVGESLDEIIDEEKADLNELLEIFVKVCDAISYAHSNNVIHLDLKPDNIQVGKYGEVQVCDWGISRNIEKEQKQNHTVNGTPGYMAPEQSVKGEILDFSTDIFALGALLYSILTADRPIEGGVNTILNTTVNKDILFPIERFPEKNIPKSLDAVVRKAMEKHKNDRYSSVSALKNDVQKYLTGRSTSAENAGFLKELKLLIKRNKQVCTVSFIAIAAIVIGTLISFQEIQKSKKATENALNELSATHNELITSREQEKALYNQKEQALNMYIAANDERQKMYNQLLDQELKHALDLMVYPLYFSSPKLSVEKSFNILQSQHKQNKKSRVIRNLLALNLFVSQKFSEFLNYENTKYDILAEIAEKFDAKPKTPLGILNETNFVILIHEINALPPEYDNIKHEVIERSICYMVDVRQPIFTSTEVVRELLKSWNPDWDPSQMEYDKDKLILRLKGKKLTKIAAWAGHSSSLCFLRFLKVDTLDIRGTSIPNLGHIDGLDINKVDIRNTPVSNLHPHGATRGIKEVILSKGQFAGKENLHVPQSVKLIYK